jgi:AhpD family alkylhydroperoxidase
MTLDNQILALIAVGASIAANCQPCLEHNVGTALECGANSQQIADAIEVGRRVRQGAASKIDKFAINVNHAIVSSSSLLDDTCECGSLKSTQEVKNG